MKTKLSHTPSGPRHSCSFTSFVDIDYKQTLSHSLLACLQFGVKVLAWSADMVLKNGDELMPARRAHERKPARDAPRVPEAERIFSRTFLGAPGEPSITSPSRLAASTKPFQSAEAEWCRVVPLRSGCFRGRTKGGWAHGPRGEARGAVSHARRT